MEFETLLEQSPSGSRVEFGVYYGDTLRLLAAHDGLTLGVDSFQGMGEPGPRDLLPDGSDPYPAGRLAARMSEVLRRVPGVALVPGWVPQVFDFWLSDVALCSVPFAFAHIDLDHYGPTMATIEWLWDRMLPGGIICCDDWFEGRDYLAAGAIQEWAADHPFTGTFGRKCWWVR